MKTKKLLKRWAELEPDRCTPTELSYCDFYVLWTKIHRTIYIRKSGSVATQHRPILEYAIREAIEARGWGCMIDVFFDRTETTVVVEEDGKIFLCCETYDEKVVAESLLSSYIDCLEASENMEDNENNEED